MYLLVFGLFFLFGLCEIYNLIPLKKRKIIYSSILLVLVLHDGLRWNMATDFKPYLDHFSNILGYYDDFGFEIGYNYLTKISYIFLGDYTFYLLLLASIVYFLYFKTLLKQTSFIIIALLFYYASMIGMLGSNRQLIALALCFFSLPFIVSRNKISFIITIGIAFMFHKTALIFVPFYWLNKSFSIKKMGIVLLISFILSYSSAIMGVFEFATFKLFPSLFEEKSSIYLSTNTSFSNSLIGSIFGLVRKILPLFLLIFLARKKFDTKYMGIVTNLIFISLISYILFNNNLQFLVGRLTVYFSIYECLVFSWFMMWVVRNIPRFKFVVFTVLFLYSIVLFYRSIEIYPEAYFPYRSIFQNL